MDGGDVNDELCISNYHILYGTECLSSRRLRSRSERLCRADFLGVIIYLLNRGNKFDDSLSSK